MQLISNSACTLYHLPVDTYPYVPTPTFSLGILLPAGCCVLTSMGCTLGSDPLLQQMTKRCPLWEMEAPPGASRPSSAPSS
jgi:hypothetical protein